VRRSKAKGAKFDPVLKGGAETAKKLNTLKKKEEKGTRPRKKIGKEKNGGNRFTGLFGGCSPEVKGTKRLCQKSPSPGYFVVVKRKKRRAKSKRSSPQRYFGYAGIARGVLFPKTVEKEGHTLRRKERGGKAQLERKRRKNRIVPLETTLAFAKERIILDQSVAEKKGQKGSVLYTKEQFV